MRTIDLPFEVTECDRATAADVWSAMAIHVPSTKTEWASIDEKQLIYLPAYNTIAREAGAQRLAARRNGFVISDGMLKRLT